MRVLLTIRRRGGPAFALALATLFGLMATGCGGSGGSSPPPPTPNPAPTVTSISPTSATAGAQAFTLTVNGSGFISSSVVNWNGSSRPTTLVTSAKLTATIPATDVTSSGTAQVTVTNPTPGGGTSAAKTFTINPFQSLALPTSMLPTSALGKSYYFVLASTGGAAPITWSVTAGSLPGGLTLDATTGLISGTVSGGSSSFKVTATDSAATPHTGSRDLSIHQVVPSLGRNDLVCSPGNTTDVATAISNGTIRASISPYHDIDVYSFHGTQGAQVDIEIFARRLQLGTVLNGTPSYLDSMMELLKSDCSTLAFNDDIDSGVIQDSKISVSATPFPSPPCPSSSGSGSAPCADITPPTALPATGTYYIRIRDFRGDGRPDMVYDLTLSGAD